MQIKNISIRIERTYDLGSYESIKATAFLSADLEENERPSDCFDDLINEAKSAIKRSVKDSIKAREEQKKQAMLTHRYMGKAIESGSAWTAQLMES